MDPLAIIRTESQRFADVLAATDPGAPCPTCPAWTADDLLWHLTDVHLFWAGVLATGARTDADVEAVEASKPERPATTAGLLALREQATTALLDQLAHLDDADPRWSWWEADQTVGFTRRMQTHEATMHRLDAEFAAGLDAGPIAPEVAAAAVDHCVDVMWGWMPDWAIWEPLALVELVATDTGQTWTVQVGHWTGTGPESGTEFDEPRGIRAIAASDGGLPVARATAAVEQLARWAWSRRGDADVTGDPGAVAALDRLIAMGIQ